MRASGDACTQIVEIGAGALLGREGAPRQVGAAVAQWLASRLRLPDGNGHVLTACGAGAALAAVYNVPLGGAAYTAEVLVGSSRPRVVVPAVATSALATVVAWPVVADAPTYHLPRLAAAGPALAAWAALAGHAWGSPTPGSPRSCSAHGR